MIDIIKQSLQLAICKGKSFDVVIRYLKMKWKINISQRELKTRQ